MVRAAMAVFDFLEGVPLTVTQSPLANAPTASVTDLEKVVAKVLSAAGIPVFLANKFTPTPELSFAVRERKAVGGVRIVASGPWIRADSVSHWLGALCTGLELDA